MSGNDYVKIAAVGGVLTAIVLGLRLDKPVGSPDSLMVFISDRANGNPGGTGELYVQHLDGSGLRRLTFSPSGLGFAANWLPAISPDGTRIAFAAQASAGAIYQLSLINIDGTGLRRLVLPTGSSQDRYPWWSPDGKRILFTGSLGPGDNRELFTVDPDNPDDLVRLTNDPAIDDFASYSPDGGSIVWMSNRSGVRNIWIMDSDGSNQRQLSFSVDDHQMPVYSPDGTMIAITVRWLDPTSPTDGRRFVVGGMNADGSDVRLLADPADVSEAPRWCMTRDGPQIIYHSDVGMTSLPPYISGNYDVYIMDPDGGRKYNLTANRPPATASFDLWPDVQRGVSQFKKPSGASSSRVRRLSLRK